MNVFITFVFFVVLKKFYSVSLVCAKNDVYYKNCLFLNKKPIQFEKPIDNSSLSYNLRLVFLQISILILDFVELVLFYLNCHWEADVHC